LNDEIETIKSFTKGPRKKIIIHTMRTTLENIIFNKLGLNDEIKNK